MAGCSSRRTSTSPTAADACNWRRHCGLRPKTGAYALVGATIVDGVGGRVISDGVVVIRDGRIAEVGSRGAVTIPSGTPLVDVAGKR